MNITNGDWTFNSLKKVPGTVATLKCNPNHSHQHGSPVVVCQKSYKWLPDPSTHCIECKSCLPFKHKEFAQITYSAQLIEDESENKNYYPASTTASLVCINSTGISQHVADVTVCTTQGWIPDTLGHCEKTCSSFNLKNGYVLYTDSRGFDQHSNVNGTIATVRYFDNSAIKIVNLGCLSTNCQTGEWKR